MPRCLMAKKWKVYPWSASQQASTTVESSAAIALNGGHHHLHEKLLVTVEDDQQDVIRSTSKKASSSCQTAAVPNEDDDDEEEIDVVTIQQNSSDTKPPPMILYQQQQQQQQHQHQHHPQQQQQQQQQSSQDETATTTTTNTANQTGSNNQTVIEHTPLPPQNYYQTSAEDYPLGENQHVVIDGKLVTTSQAQLLPSVIQQHTSHPTPQIRLTSVIHHGANFIQSGSSMQQASSGQAGMHHSASPMQPQSAWGPSSPTEGATAPSPPPHIQHSSDSDVTTIHYNGYSTASDINHYTAFLPSDGSTSTSRSYATLQSPNESRAAAAAAVAAAAALAAGNTISASPVSPGGSSSPPSSGGSSPTGSSGGTPRTRSLAMCFTSTGAALSLPPKKKDIYRPYSLDDRPSVRWRPPEDLTAAHAILDLSASPPAPAPSQSLQSSASPTTTAMSTTQHSQHQQQSPHSGSGAPTASIKTVIPTKPTQTKTIAYTYEAFFVSDGRSKKKSVSVDNTTLAGSPGVAGVAATITAQAVATDQRPKYTCSECGKQYATSSNLSRHKQTHRSLDSQSAKKCVTCGKAYVSMPALAMHLLTHKLNHACGICGKLFSRPWLLQGHLRSHTGEKPYGCAHCGKAFADRSNLRAHMQTHSTDKNFECTRCHKTFALKSYLNKHLESACVGDTNECNTAISANQVPTITHLR